MPGIPSLRGRVVLKFPADVVAGHGIIITRTNQTYTFSVDESQLEFPGGPEGGIPEAPLDGQQYGRQSGAWTVIEGDGGIGDIPNPLIINKTAPSGQTAAVIGAMNGLFRWRLNLGDVSAESTGTQGSDFRLDSYNDDGTFRNIVIHADRETSEVTITAGPVPHHSILSLNKFFNGQAATLQGKTSGSLRWGVALGDGVSESGGNAGSNFRINSYDDAGNFTRAPFFIERSTGKIMLTGGDTPQVPILAINKLVSGQAAAIQGQTAGVARWQVSLGDVLGESGTSSGSDFRIQRYNNAGVLQDVPFWIQRDTGRVTITGFSVANAPQFVINKAAGGMPAAIQGQTATSPRWQMALGDGTAESGGNTGSDFRLQRYSDTGVLIDVPMWIRRNDGVVTFTGSPPDQKPIVVINKTSGAGGQASAIQGQTLTSVRWHLALGDGGAEQGGNLGSDFRIHRHSDGGAFLGAALYLTRAQGIFAVFNNEAYKPGGGPWLDNSDSRIKTVLGNYSNGLSAIKQLQPVRYKYNGNDVRFHTIVVGEAPSVGTSTYIEQSDHKAVVDEEKEFIGLIAQAAEIPMPEMVKQVPAKIDGVAVTDMRVMDTGPLIFALVNAVKELAGRVEALEAARRDAPR